MARQASADPVVKLTISIPSSLLNEARKRAKDLDLDFSKYIQHLVSTDCALKPSEVRRYQIAADGRWRASGVAIPAQEVDQALVQAVEETIDDLAPTQPAEPAPDKAPARPRRERAPRKPRSREL